MGACGLRLTVVLFVLAALALPSPAAASRDAGLAALQVALNERGLYAGSIDGINGPATTAAIKRLQRRAGLAVDGVAGPKTRQVLGRYGRHVLGSRLLARGARGWDVAALQFLLAWHGFPSATIDGVLGVHTDRALRRFHFIHRRRAARKNNAFGIVRENLFNRRVERQNFAVHLALPDFTRNELRVLRTEIEDDDCF